MWWPRWAAGSPADPSTRQKTSFADPHAKARGMISEFELPGDNDPVAIVSNPIKFTATPTGFHRRAPRLGEHGAEIRAMAGRDQRNEEEE